MALRIAIAGFAHETNTFAAAPTGLDAFVANRLFRGDELRELVGTNTVVGGAIEEIDRAGTEVEAVPLVATSAIPGGLVTAEAFETVVGEITEGLAAARPDAVPDWWIAGHRKEPTGRPPGRPRGAKDARPRARPLQNLPALT